ncbi:hypothetical protein HPB50_013458 [Hyalomma asiaticum]|uniref:Uncharacterized protein n=1 Tax=Hyalomma asiaticum TaxID=266040 RepID=A0ACB7S6B4_HYAAI|nr:hypothetical protein HPB50_013458 [Hyalomma asiaticum]
MIEYARAHFVPTVFALKRRHLGTLAKKNVAVSCVGIFDYSAREQGLPQGDSKSGDGQEVKGETQSASQSALHGDSGTSASVVEDGWMTVNDESEAEDLEDSPMTASVDTPNIVDTVTRLLASSLRFAGGKS